MRPATPLVLIALVAAAGGVSDTTNEVINRDIVIVGGGASGAHAAVKLRDMGKTIVLVEKRDKLVSQNAASAPTFSTDCLSQGGHTETYQDPLTGKPINVGVQAWTTYKNTTDFITKRMNLSVVVKSQTSLATKYVDFTTGQALDSYTAPTSAEALAALRTYHELCKQYEQLLLPGYFDFPLPDNIPEDLTLLFRDFVAKYNISAAVPRLFQLTGVGLGDM